MDNFALLQQFRILMSAKFNKKLVCLMAWNMSMSLFHFGYFLLYVTQIPIATVKDLYDIPLGDAISEGLLNGCIPIGGLIGSLGSSYFISEFSRRENMLLCNAFLFIVGWFLFAQNFPMFLICRLCQGIAVGFFTSITPLIVNEIAPTEMHGALGTYIQLNIILGVFFGCLIPYILRKITGDETGRAYWYLVFALPQIIIIIQSLVLLFYYPYETPKYHLSVGQQKQARELLEIIYRPEYVQEILKQKKNDLQIAESKDKDLAPATQISLVDGGPESVAIQQITTPKWAVIVSVHLAALLQFSGTNVVAVYAVAISASITSGELLLFMPTIINSTAVFATIGSYFLFNCVGRRPILIYGTLVEGIANILILVGYFIKDSTPSGTTIIFVGIFLFMFTFGLTVGPIVWLYIPEIVQPSVMPFSIAVNWITASVVIILFPILTKNYLNDNPAIIFIFSAAWCLISSLFNYFFVLETKGKGEKEVRQQFLALKMC